jgi:hypothetical protein
LVGCLLPNMFSSISSLALKPFSHIYDLLLFI